MRMFRRPAFLRPISVRSISVRSVSLRALTLGFCFLSLPAVAKINVFACEPEWKDLVDQLGGQHLKSYSATTAFQDTHFIEARPSLIAKTRRADLVVCTGAELEVGWLPVLLRKSGNAAIQEGTPGLFLAADKVALIDVPQVLDRSHGDVHASGNPHVHWDPYRLMTIAKALSERLAALDAGNASVYQSRYEAFAADWREKIARWESMAAPLKGKKVIVQHKNYRYLLEWLGIEVVGDLEPKPGLPPTSRHLSSLLSSTKGVAVDYILVANYQDSRGAKWLSKRTNIPVKNLPFTVGGNDNADSLATLYEDVLVTLLGQQ